MIRFRPIVLFILTTFLGAACTVSPINSTPTPIPTLLPTATAIPPTQPLPTATPTREPLTLQAAIYILDDEAGTNSSARTVDELADVYERVNSIWAQADVVVDVITIERITVPSSILAGIVDGDFFTFFNAVNIREINLPLFAPIVGFYVRDLGGPNGINPANSNTFFVMDTPSVHDERVTSHEIGHILGLHHVLDDAGRLMYSGTNGTALSDEEQAVARYSAKGILDRVR